LVVQWLVVGGWWLVVGGVGGSVVGVGAGVGVGVGAGVGVSELKREQR
jgi:hypothetical protein